MDEGDWGTPEDETEGWEYSGPYWQGSPQDYALHLEGGAGEPIGWMVDADTYDGNFIYDSMDPAPASGRVAGLGVAEWCEDLGETVFF
jgi:hypothetical protein